MPEAALLPQPQRITQSLEIQKQSRPASPPLTLPHRVPSVLLRDARHCGGGAGALGRRGLALGDQGHCWGRQRGWGGARVWAGVRTGSSQTPRPCPPGLCLLLSCPQHPGQRMFTEHPPRARQRLAFLRGDVSSASSVRPHTSTLSWIPESFPLLTLKNHLGGATPPL